MLIVGTRPNTKLLGQIAYICPSCQHNSWHSVGQNAPVVHAVLRAGDSFYQVEHLAL